MQPSSGDPVDVITLFTVLLALVTSPDIAKLLAPYSGIVLAAVAGSGACLYEKREVMLALNALWYVAMRILLAVTLTVALAEGLQYIFQKAEPRLWVIPIAFLIGYVRDYEQVQRVGKFYRFVRNLLGGRDGNK